MFPFPPRIEQAIDLSGRGDRGYRTALDFSPDATPETDWCMREILRARDRDGGPRSRSFRSSMLHAKYPTVDDLPAELGFLPFLGGAEILTTRPADEEIAALETRLAILEREIVTARRTPNAASVEVFSGSPLRRRSATSFVPRSTAKRPSRSSPRSSRSRSLTWEQIWRTRFCRWYTSGRRRTR